MPCRQPGPARQHLLDDAVAFLDMLMADQLHHAEAEQHPDARSDEGSVAGDGRGGDAQAEGLDECRGESVPILRQHGIDLIVRIGLLLAEPCHDLVDHRMTTITCPVMVAHSIGRLTVFRAIMNNDRHRRLPICPATGSIDRLILGSRSETRKRMTHDRRPMILTDSP